MQVIARMHHRTRRDLHHTMALNEAPPENVVVKDVTGSNNTLVPFTGPSTA